MIFSYFDVKNAHFVFLIIKIVLLQDSKRKCDLKNKTDKREATKAFGTSNLAVA